MLDKLKEFKETLSERIRSPFIGSLIITWSLIHWKIYALFLFEQNDISVLERVTNIESYLSTKDKYELFVYPILITLGVLIIYNFLNAIGLTIKLLYDNWASPYIQQVLYNKNIIQKSKYEKLKREYAVLKKESDEDKEARIAAEENARNTNSEYELLKSTSFAGKYLDEISEAMTPNSQWTNTFTLAGGKSGNEVFTIEKNGFEIVGGKFFKIENIKCSPDRKILTFNKIIDGVPHTNYLIRDNEMNYFGVEDESTHVVYKKVKSNGIIIQNAQYKCENNFMDVTAIIQKIVDNNTTEFKVTNTLMGGDPGYGKQKKLFVNYIKDNKFKSITSEEDTIFKFE